MNWTTPADLKSQVQRLWARGLLLAAIVDGQSLFPRRLTLKGPDSRQLSERFDDVRQWITELTGAASQYRIVWRTLNHRIVGSNQIPAEIWIDSLDDALGLIGKRRAAIEFTSLVTLTREKRPELLAWLSKRSLRALELVDSWPRLLETVTWLREHPRPDIYLRQIDLPCIHSKFIEQHRGVLEELFDLSLPQESVDTSAAGAAGFCRRFGFREKPLKVRFRILDPALAILPGCADHEITVTQETFASLDIPATRIFVTENEINFLAFPPCTSAMVIFGAGYGFRNLAPIDWLHERKLFYWGDIDTHGFAILNQFRELFPQTTSFLMDRQTLLDHQQHWETEPSPEHANLTRLTHEEIALYDDLRLNRLGNHIRFEQEKIGFTTLHIALAKL